MRRCKCGGDNENCRWCHGLGYVRDGSRGGRPIVDESEVISFTEPPKEPPNEESLRNLRRRMWWEDVGKPLILLVAFFGIFVLLRSCQ